MLPMFNARELRQIHEERIAPYIKSDDASEKPKQNPQKEDRKVTSNLLKWVTGKA